METFIHYSSNNKIYHSNDPDSIERVGILIERNHKGTFYTANNLTQYKRYKTLRGAENFMKKSGRKPIAYQEGNSMIYLTSAAEKTNVRKRK